MDQVKSSSVLPPRNCPAWHDTVVAAVGLFTDRRNRRYATVPVSGTALLLLYLMRSCLASSSTSKYSTVQYSNAMYSIHVVGG